MQLTRFFIVVLVLLGAGSAEADIIINGDFENLVGYSPNNIPGWTVVQHYWDVYYVTSPTHNYQGHALQIAGSGKANEPDILSQTVTDTPGQSYDLSFWLQVSIGSGTQAEDLTVKWNNTTVYSELVVDPYPYKQVVASVVGNGSDTLEFICNNGSFTYLDDVSLSTVPEPSTLILSLLGGFGIAGAYLRRRKAA
jgi:hypothetical protein